MPSKVAHSIDAYVAGRLRGLRLQHGVSQSEIAKEIGVTFQQIQKYEAGINRITAGRLYQIAGLFGVPVQDFFPKSAATTEGRRKTEKLDEMTAFAASPLGTELCEAFLRVIDPKKRKVIISLVREMADE